MMTIGFVALLFSLFLFLPVPSFLSLPESETADRRRDGAEQDRERRDERHGFGRLPARGAEFPFDGMLPGRQPHGAEHVVGPETGGFRAVDVGRPAVGIEDFGEYRHALCGGGVFVPEVVGTVFREGDGALGRRVGGIRRPAFCVMRSWGLPLCWRSTGSMRQRRFAAA